MRKYLIIAVAALASSLAFTSIAQADDIQSLTAKLTPKKLDKKKFKPAQIYVEILTGDNTSDPTYPEQPPSATRTKVNFPANMKFDTKAAPKCKVSNTALDGTSTDTATDMCGKKSIVSVGCGEPTSAGHSTGTSAWVTIDSPGTSNSTLEVPVVVTAYNGKDEELPVPARACQPARRHHGARRQDQGRPEGLRQAARRDDPAACSRCDHPVHDHGRITASTSRLAARART